MRLARPEIQGTGKSPHPTKLAKSSRKYATPKVLVHLSGLELKACETYFCPGWGNRVQLEPKTLTCVGWGALHLNFALVPTTASE
ncbi:hypothetical protein [Nostoc sp. CHAB 5715]|uniref:hypothetical protein n=1 Tax=Nostoc sp. CHAB 5715 TaxID=2780400 RepID=UPI001E64461E|nr:hypothetical protein [Nostoc sp. CHAB 5715]MCC5620594.1 hypothetical protein [Nostoc sp. CHAB 5715]